MWRASFGRCSLMRIPLTEVSISLNGPPVGWPGLRSKVSIWLGPPVIQRKMTDRARGGALPVAALPAGYGVAWAAGLSPACSAEPGLGKTVAPRRVRLTRRISTVLSLLGAI